MDLKPNHSQHTFVRACKLWPLHKTNWSIMHHMLPLKSPNHEQQGSKHLHVPVASDSTRGHLGYTTQHPLNHGSPRAGNSYHIHLAMGMDLFVFTGEKKPPVAFQTNGTIKKSAENLHALSLKNVVFLCSCTAEPFQIGWWAASSYSKWW